MNAPAPKPPTLIETAIQMLRDGYGYEDLQVRLKISREAARQLVFGSRKK